MKIRDRANSFPLGDHVTKLIKLTKVDTLLHRKECAACRQRREYLNELGKRVSDYLHEDKEN